MPDNCKHWQELLAEHALTTGPRRRAPDTGMNDDLASHLAGCVECQAVASEFRSVAQALNYIGAIDARSVATAAPAGLTARINARLARSSWGLSVVESPASRSCCSRAR